MVVVAERAMGRKKSEERRHTGMLRVDAATLDRAKLASSLMRMSLADWATEVLAKAAERDITREARKLASQPDEPPPKR
jgi:hypothetical protein